MIKRNKKSFGPINAILITMLIVMIVTSLLSIIGFEGQKTIISNNKLETYLITINNIFSINGIKYLFGNAVSNFSMFQPLFYFILSLISLSIFEKSGLLKEISHIFKRIKFKYLLILTLIVSIISIYLGDYSYAFILPFFALLYKAIGKNPILGIITAFLGLTIGYGLGFIWSFNNYTLGTITQVSAQLDVDKTYLFNLNSTLYISLSCTIILIILLANLIEKKLATKFNNPEIENDELVTSKEGRQYVKIIVFGLLIFIAYLIIPGSSYTGFLLDNNANDYLEKLFGSNSPFREGLPYIITLSIMLCGYVYGKISGNIKNSKEYSEALSSAFKGTGYIFVLMFFMSQLIGIVNWTNIGEVLTTNLLDFMSSFPMTGLPLIFMAFIIILIISILLPSCVDKWILIAPVIIPLFMRANITPDYTQFMFSLTEGLGKCMTPIFPYYILMFGLIQKYKDKNEFSLYGTMKLMMPIILTITGIMLLILLGWFLIGLPLGISTFPSL